MTSFIVFAFLTLIVFTEMEIYYRFILHIVEILAVSIVKESILEDKEPSLRRIRYFYQAFPHFLDFHLFIQYLRCPLTNT